MNGRESGRTGSASADPVGQVVPAGTAAGRLLPGGLLNASSALLWGLQFALLSPVLALLLTGLYGATPAEVGWVLAVYNAGGFVASLGIPAWADRRRRYLAPMLWAAVLTVALAAALAFATRLPIAAIALIVLGGPASVGTTLLFAQLRHARASLPEVMNTRAIISFAWVAGPPLATLVMGAFGHRAILPVLALIGLLNVCTTAVMMRRAGARGRSEADAADGAPRAAGASAQQAPAPVSVAPIGFAAISGITLGFVLLQATNAAAMSVMTLFVSVGLGLPLVWGGVVLAVAAVLEIPALWLLGRISERLSARVLLLSGCAAGIAYYAVLMLVHDPVTLIAAQVLNAWSFAVVSGTGMTLFQEMIPRPGLATGLFMNTRRIGAIVAGGIIALAGVAPFYYVGMFGACTAATALATLLVVLATARRERTRARAQRG